MPLSIVFRAAHFSIDSKQIANPYIIRMHDRSQHQGYQDIYPRKGQRMVGLQVIICPKAKHDQNRRLGIKRKERPEGFAHWTHASSLLNAPDLDLQKPAK